MQADRCAFSFVLLLAAGLPHYGTLTTTEPDELSGNGISNSIPFTWTSTPFTIREETDIPGEASPTSTTSGRDSSDTDHTMGYEVDNDTTTLNYSSAFEVKGMDMSSILLFSIPVVILLLAVPLIIFFVKRQRRKRPDKETTENEDIKSPIFEEDTPSVMEIEMEELDKWMSMMKNGNRLSTLEEENKLHLSQSDNES